MSHSCSVTPPLRLPDSHVLTCVHVPTLTNYVTMTSLLNLLNAMCTLVLNWCDTAITIAISIVLTSPGF